MCVCAVCLHVFMNSRCVSVLYVCSDNFTARQTAAEPGGTASGTTYRWLPTSICILNSVLVSHKKINSEHLQTDFSLTHNMFCFLQSGQRKQQKSVVKVEAIATYILVVINQLTTDPSDNAEINAAFFRKNTFN